MVCGPVLPFKPSSGGGGCGPWREGWAPPALVWASPVSGGQGFSPCGQRDVGGRQFQGATCLSFPIPARGIDTGRVGEKSFLSDPRTGAQPGAEQREPGPQSSSEVGGRGLLGAGRAALGGCGWRLLLGHSLRGSTRLGLPRQPENSPDAAAQRQHSRTFCVEPAVGRSSLWEVTRGSALWVLSMGPMSTAVPGLLLVGAQPGGGGGSKGRRGEQSQPPPVPL